MTRCLGWFLLVIASMAIGSVCQFAFGLPIGLTVAAIIAITYSLAFALIHDALGKS